MKKARPFFYLILILLIQSCVDIPDEVTVPEYNVQFTIPVADRNYTLEEAVEDDSTNLKWSTDSLDFGLLYFTDEIKLEKIDIEDNLKADPFTTSSSNLIGPMKLENVEGIQTDITYSDWGVAVVPGSFPFPATIANVNSDFTLINDFTTAVFDQTSEQNVNILSLKFTNRFPVEVSVNSLQIENKSDGKIVAETSNPTSIPSGDSRTIDFNLSGKDVASLVVFTGVLETAGSVTNVDITNNDKLEIEAGFSPKLVFSEANAKLPAQSPVTKNASFGVDDSTKLTSALIKTGSFDFRFENTLDLDINMEFTSPSLKTASGETYSKNIVIKRKDVTNLVENDLSNWEIIPNASGKIDYSYVISTEATSDFRTVNKNEGVLVDADFSEITFKSVSGKLKPIKFTFDDKTTELDIGEFKDKLTYDNINVEKAEIKLKLNSSANVDLKLDASVNVEYPGGEKRSEDFTAMVPSTSTIINFANLINNTSGELPDEFILKGNAIVNPDYLDNVSASETDTVGGTALIEIPLNAQVTGGTIIDTVEMDDSDIDDEDAERLTSAELTIEITNKIAAGGTFSGVIVDEAGEELIKIPPRDVTSDGQTSQLIKLTAAETDANGEVINPGYTTQKIEIFGDDVKKFIKGKNFIINIDFDTASPSRTVKFKYTDEIIVRVTAVANIKVSE